MGPSRCRAAGCVQGLMAVALLAVASPGLAQGAQASLSDRMTDAITRMIPLGQIFEQAAANDPGWPFQENRDAVSDDQLRCLRAELSKEGYRRAKHAEVEAYAKAHPSRMAEEVRLLEGGAAELFGRLVEAGAASALAGKEVDAEAVLKTASPEQFLSFMTLMSDPNHADVRKLAGVGNALGIDKSADENKDAGEQLGSSLVVQQMIKSMGTCEVPLSAIF